MSTLREDNHKLEQSVEELRADRRAQERKMRDLEHQLALSKEKQVADVPQLPVEVVAPANAPAAAAMAMTASPAATATTTPKAGRTTVSFR